MWFVCSFLFSHGLVLVTSLLWEVRVGMRIWRCGQGLRLRSRDVYHSANCAFVRRFSTGAVLGLVADVPAVVQ